MQPHSRRIFLPLLLLALFCFAPEARADTVTVTNGWITFFGSRDFSLQGSGLSISGFADETVLPGRLIETLLGDRAELGRSFLDDDILYPSGPFTVGGITYSQYLFNEDNFRLSITADAFDLPTDPSVTSATFSSTFTMTGVLGLSTYLRPDGQVYDLAGQGIVTATYTRAPGYTIWALRSLNYTFQAPPTPTPEPATLLLLGTGLAGAAARAHRRRKQD